MSGTSEINLTINGQSVTGTVEPRTSLADFVRESERLTGTHLGCEHGVCGSCTVLLDGEAVRSCLLFAVQTSGHSVTTVEGLTPADGLSDVQEALRDCHGLQCGFCTPGFVVSIEVLLRDDPEPDEADVRAGISGNLCRCTGYQGIVEAVRRASATRRGEAGS